MKVPLFQDTPVEMELWEEIDIQAWMNIISTFHIIFKLIYWPSSSGRGSLERHGKPSVLPFRRIPPPMSDPLALEIFPIP